MNSLKTVTWLDLIVLGVVTYLVLICGFGQDTLNKGTLMLVGLFAKKSFLFYARILALLLIAGVATLFLNWKSKGDL